MIKYIVLLFCDFFFCLSFLLSSFLPSFLSFLPFLPSSLSIIAWSDTEPVIESWLSPKNPRRKAETKEDEDDGGEVDPSVLHEINGVPVRTDEKTLAMDPDHMYVCKMIYFTRECYFTLV